MMVQKTIYFHLVARKTEKVVERMAQSIIRLTKLLIY